MNNRIYPNIVIEKAIKEYNDKHLKIKYRTYKIRKIKEKITKNYDI
jgi:hypothetical protein